MQRKVTEVKVPPAVLAGAGDQPAIALLEWHAREGEFVKAEQELLDLITPVGLHSVSAPRAGRLSEILAEEGSPVDPGQIVALIEEQR
ncbi:MAG: lipoyl domain-containing protein [Planctomycetota bacterium]